MITEALELFFICITLVMIAYLVRHYLFTFSVLRKAKAKAQQTVVDSEFQPSVSILIPALNEEKVIGRLLQRISGFTYPKEKMQVVIINDASTDRTQKIAEEFTGKYAYMQILNRERSNGRRGKAAAMNQGFNECTGEIVLCFDADYYPQRDIVESLVKEFVDQEVGAVQGRVVVLNEPQNLVTRLVAMERIGGYRVDQKARNDLALITQFGGTIRYLAMSPAPSPFFGLLDLCQDNCR